MTTRALSFPLLLLALGTVLTVPARSAPAKFPDSLLARWRGYQRAAHAPGVAVVLVRDSGIVARAELGERDAERHLPVTSHTRFYIASCTKPFVAAALWSLAADAAIDLDAPVRRYWRDFALATPGATDSLTVRDLLSHRRGLSQTAIGLLSAYTGQLTPERRRYWLARVRPRDRFAYSNLHYQIAGEVLARCTGLTWQRAVESRVTRPVGMTRAAFTAAQIGSDPDVARPYAFREGRLERLEAKSDRTLHAAGGMGASIDDIARWLRAQLGDGSIDGRRALPAVAVRGMRAMAVATTERHPLRPDLVRAGWSAGWEVRTEGGDTIYVHTGSYAGAAAHMSYCPARGIGVAVLANAAAPPLTELLAIEAYDLAAGRASPDVSTRLAQVMTRFLPSASADSLPRRPGDAPSRYSGRFRDPHWGDVVTAVRGDEVTMRIGELAVPLRWRGPDTFFADGDTPGRFERDRTGRVVAVWLTLAPGDSARFARR